MSDKRHDGKAQIDPSASSEAARTTQDEASGYLGHVRSVLLSPDAFFAADHRSDRGHAVIDIVFYATAVFLAAMFARITGYSGWGFEFGYVIDAAKSTLTVGIALACAVAGFVMYGARGGSSRSMNFYLEKIGGGLLLPALLLLAALVLDLLDIRVHSWFRGLSMAFVYALVFAFAYGYASSGRLKAAAVFLAGFYVIYRLLALLF